MCRIENAVKNQPVIASSALGIDFIVSCPFVVTVVSSINCGVIDITSKVSPIMVKEIAMKKCFVHQRFKVLMSRIGNPRTKQHIMVKTDRVIAIIGWKIVSPTKLSKPPS